MKVKVRWLDGVSFEGENESKHSFVMDGPSELGGKNKGMRPMEALLISMGGCTSFDVVTILTKSRQIVESCEAIIEAERVDKIPKVFKLIHIHFVFKGKNLDPNIVERAIKLSAEKYCSASIMLGQSVNITHDYEILS